jgi:hypothetical protein
MVIPRLKSLYHYHCGYICADAIVDTLVQQYLMYGSYLQIHEGELAITTQLNSISRLSNQIKVSRRHLGG